MKLKLKEATTSKLVKLFIQDSSQTDGSGLTGLAHNSSGLTCYWIAEGDASATSVTLATATVGTFTSGGFKEVDSTNMPGVYEFGIPDAAIDATSEGSVLVMLKGATNMAPVLIEIELDAIDYQDSVRAGLTSLPNAAADAAGGLPISDAGGLDLDAVLSGNTPQTGDNYARLGAPAGASIAADIATVVTDTNELQTDWADGGRLDLILDARASQSSVDTINGNVDAILVDTGTSIPGTLTTIASYIDTEIGTIITHLTDIKGAGWSSSTDTLEEIRDRGDAAWTTATGGDATAANQTTIISHLTDIKGASWTTTDTLEAIRDRGDAAWTTGSGNLGVGADEVTLNIKVGGINLADADVWVTSDSAGTTVVAGTKQTDSNGNVTLMLDDGNTYYLWVQKDGYTSIQGESFVAVAD